MTAASTTGADTVFCRDCGEEIRAAAEICPACGIRQRAKGERPASGNPSATDETSFVDRIATPMSWVAVGILCLLALGTITESVSGMPVRLWSATVIYLLFAAFAAPPVRRHLEDVTEMDLSREVVVLVLVIGPLANEGLVAPPLA